MYLVLLCLLWISQTIAPGKTYPWSLLNEDISRWIWLGISIIFILLTFQSLGRRTYSDFKLQSLVESIITHRSFYVLLAVLNAAYLVLSFIKFQSVGYQFPVLSLVVCAFAVLVLRPTSILYAFIFNVVLLILSIYYFPLTGFRSDMALVIENGLSLWANGESPYQLLDYSWGKSGMPYFPGILFSHLPAWSLGLDVRWNQVLYRILWMSLLFRKIKEFELKKSDQALISFFVLNPYYNFRHDLYFEFFLFLTACYFSFRKFRFLVIPMIGLGWQWGLPLMPYLCWDWVFQRKKKFFSSAVLLTLGFLLVGSIFVGLLYSTTSFQDFWKVTFSIVKDVTSAKGYTKDYGITLGPLLYNFSLASFTTLIQFGGCAIVFLLYLLSGLKATQQLGTNSALITELSVIRHASLTLILFVLLSVHFWQYFWIFPTFWMLWGHTVSQDKRGNIESTSGV